MQSSVLRSVLLQALFMAVNTDGCITVYQGDMVKGVEDLRTKLSTILFLEQQIRGTIAGFMTPSFVIDLPEGGGKRLACFYNS